MRKPHKLRTNPKLEFPCDLVFVDTETTTIGEDETFHEPKLRVGGVHTVELNECYEYIFYGGYTFKTVKIFWDILNDFAMSKQEIWVFAHNWSFDFPVLNGFDMLKMFGWTIDAVVDESPPVIIRCSKDKRKMIFIDTLNYWRVPLSVMGESCGIPKKEVDFDTCTTDELREYMHNDIEIIKTCVVNLIQYLYKNNLSRLTHTFSSLALSIYIRRFKPCDIYIDGKEDRVAVSRASYFGGRTECFRIGRYKGPLYLIDVNSMYPYVMRENLYPYQTFAHYKNGSIGEMKQAMEQWCVTARCDIETDKPVFPYKIDGRTCFPIGRFNTSLSTPELRYAVDHGYIKKINEFVLHRSAPLFARYVNYFYNERLRAKKISDDMTNDFAKRLLNSLYGKFGQTGHNWKKSHAQPRGYNGKWFEIDQVDGCRLWYLELNGQVYESEKTEESRDSYPAIAAHVTAYGRMLIFDMIEKIGREHCYYCDTDSLLIDETGFDKIHSELSPTELGKWSLDGEYKKVIIRGAKDYEFDEKVKIKGIKKNAVLVREGLYRQLQFSSLKGIIKENEIIPGNIKRVEKHLERIYKKGEVDQNGVVHPFVLDELED